MTNENTDTLEVTSVEVPEELNDLFDFSEPATEVPPAEQPPAAAPPPQTEAPPAPQDGQAPSSPTAAQEPSEVEKLLANIPEEQRTAVLDGLLAKLPPEERAKLGTVDEIVRDVAAQAAEQGRVQGQTRAARVDHDKAINDAWEALFPPQSDESIRANRQRYEEAVAAKHSRTVLDTVTSTLWDSLRALNKIEGQPEVSPQMQQRLQQARSPQEYVSTVAAIIDAYAFNQGKEAAKAESSRESKANEALTKKRLYDEALMDAAKNGRVRIGKDNEGLFAEYVKDDLPPPIGGEAAAIAGGITQERFERLMQDQDAYEKATEQERAEVNRLMAEALAGAR